MTSILGIKPLTLGLQGQYPTLMPGGLTGEFAIFHINKHLFFCRIQKPFVTKTICQHGLLEDILTLEHLNMKK